MRKQLRRALQLSIRFAQLGGMAGTAIFLSQGEFAKALQCTLVAALCILILTLVMAVSGSFRE